MPEIRKIERLPVFEKRARTAAYCRVSSDKDEQLHSLSSQVSYYNNLIRCNAQWEFAGVFYDEAKTGTKENRPGFQNLLQACQNGKIDQVIVKSISRFARNTVTLLNSVRDLKNLGVDVYFEEQNIHTMSAEGELILTILASYAEEESRSISENIRWRIQKNFKSGLPWNVTMLGYRFDGSKLIVSKEEAETVKSIFDLFLDGHGLQSIADILNQDKKTTRYGKPFSSSGVRSILYNYAYTGNLMLQTTFQNDPLKKQTVKNQGQVPMYSVKESHEAIINIDVFEKVQRELKKRAALFYTAPKHAQPYVFTSKIKCGLCGKNYARKYSAGRPVWICRTYNHNGKNACPAKIISEEKLIEACCEVLKTDIFDEEVFNSTINYITAMPDNVLVFRLIDGATIKTVWRDRSRSESWTNEMKEAARQKALENMRG